MIGFSPVSATIGGALIGLGAGLLWIINGRVAGVSNIFGSLIFGALADLPWRLLFLVGLPLGAAIGLEFGPDLISDMSGALPKLGLPPALIAVAGFLVGVGTALARGCTSGHGVVGLANLSVRSFLAVAIFMTTAVLTVLFAKQWP
ncbi:YeeE/YedE family protein [Mesorhizobium sp. BR1-1-16]|uniref:YeeE/YedE family protein n=1 Tax=Mesorhizobium sp. BR1-1-16 TaxID=2876653 RepID=UPI001CCC4C7C|nr:YeeE/YedE thiosulfate transporter family protein [Mesorhizobium sp. BR1-1-16]MBZ9937839.1 YeeE/YedE family protein [Mesorhizobium sp. BR1-1-16]